MTNSNATQKRSEPEIKYSESGYGLSPTRIRRFQWGFITQLLSYFIIQILSFKPGGNLRAEEPCRGKGVPWDAKNKEIFYYPLGRLESTWILVFWTLVLLVLVGLNVN